MGDFLNDWLGGINNMFGMDQAPVPRNEYNNNPPRAGTSSNGWSEVPNYRKEHAANYRQASNYVQSYPENRRSGVYQYPPTGSGVYRQDSAGSGTYVYPQNSGSRSSSSYEVGPRYPSVGQVVVERSRDSIPAVLPPRITSNRGIPVQMGTESTPRASVIYHSSPSPGPDAAPWYSGQLAASSISPVKYSPAQTPMQYLPSPQASAAGSRQPSSRQISSTSDLLSYAPRSVVQHISETRHTHIPAAPFRPEPAPQPAIGNNLSFSTSYVVGSSPPRTSTNSTVMSYAPRPVDDKFEAVQKALAKIESPPPRPISNDSSYKFVADTIASKSPNIKKERSSSPIVVAHEMLSSSGLGTSSREFGSASPVPANRRRGARISRSPQPNDKDYSPWENYAFRTYELESGKDVQAPVEGRSLYGSAPARATSSPNWRSSRGASPPLAGTGLYCSLSSLVPMRKDVTRLSNHDFNRAVLEHTRAVRESSSGGGAKSGVLQEDEGEEPSDMVTV